MAFRFPGECLGPHESIAVGLSKSDGVSVRDHQLGAGSLSDLFDLRVAAQPPSSGPREAIEYHLRERGGGLVLLRPQRGPTRMLEIMGTGQMIMVRGETEKTPEPEATTELPSATRVYGKEGT